MQSKQGMSREQPGAPGHTSLGIADKDSEGKNLPPLKTHGQLQEIQAHPRPNP